MCPGCPEDQLLKDLELINIFSGSAMGTDEKSNTVFIAVSACLVLPLSLLICFGIADCHYGATADAHHLHRNIDYTS